MMTNARIVLIEDNPADVYLIEMALRRYDIAYDVSWFENGAEATDALCGPDFVDQQAVPDLILLDLNTPACDGFEVLTLLKAAPGFMNVPVAVISSSQAKSDCQRSLELGASRYIEKASRLDEFLSTVGQAVKELLPAQVEASPAL